MKEKFILSRSRLFKELFYLRQGDLSVTEYKLKFEKFDFECGFQIKPLPTMYIKRETCIIPEGFEAESFPLKYNLTTSECKIHYVEVDLYYFK